jgi:hypothetical protein
LLFGTTVSRVALQMRRSREAGLRAASAPFLTGRAARAAEEQEAMDSRLSYRNRTSRMPADPTGTEAGESPERQLEERIQFRDDGWSADSPAARAFRHSLCDALRGEEVERLRVRCGITRSEGNELRFMCKVEIAADSTRTGAAGYAWSWWSPLVESPAELVGELGRALQNRRARLSPPPAKGRVDALADKSRGLPHGTWSTDLWDLGRGEPSEGFCRNRRARWTSYAESSRPFRPRGPR